MRQTVTVLSEPRGSAYRCLLELALTEAAKAYLIVRPTVSLDPSAEIIMASLKGHELGSRDVSAWPGTTLLAGRTARMFEYRMSPALVSVLALHADGLYDWQQPQLPEDLGFVRADGTLWLASIAHEGDSYFEISEEERQKLRSTCPTLANAIEL